MERALTRFTSGRGRIAIIMMVCLVAVLALPAMAHAAVFAGEYPSNNATPHAGPGFVSVDVFTALKVKSATITVNNVPHAATIIAGSNSGSWGYSETADVNGVFHGTWTYSTGSSAAVTSLYVSDVATATGHYTVVATGLDNTGVTIGSDSWAFDVLANVVNPVVVPAAANQTCRSSNCHGTQYDNDNAMGAICSDCHIGNFGPHYFNNVTSVSGHNTTLQGTQGAYSDFSNEGVVVKSSTGATITQEWPLPTTSVFWSQSKGLSMSGAADGSYSLNPTDSPAVAMAAKGLTTAAINQTVGWGSVITCEDCHSGLSAAGPNGSAAINAGLDPNFPDDWTKAEITSWDPTGMRSIATTMGTGNPYYKQVNTSISGGTFPTVSSPNPAVATIVATAPVGAFMVPVTTGANIAAIGPSSPASKTVFYAVYDGSAQADSRAVMSTSYSRGATPGSKFICQKCHKLANSYQGIIIEGNGRGGRDNNLNYMGMSNEAHMEHHNDLINGQGNCASCHIAIPHGWKRPRLLVYESDPAPYKTQQFFTDSTAKAFYTTGALVNSPAQDTSNGNWGYFGPVQPSYLGQAVANPNSTLYKQIGAAIPNGSVGTTSTAGVWSAVNGLDTGGKTQVVNNAGRTFSSHLEKLSASPLALKELENGPDLAAWTSNDTTNSTSWGKWYTGTGGTGWIADANPSALYTDEAAQNNCTACSSAGLTHVDTGGTGEGVADNAVPGRQANDGTGLHNGNLNQGGGGTWTAVPYWK